MQGTRIGIYLPCFYKQWSTKEVRVKFSGSSLSINLQHMRFECIGHDPDHPTSETVGVDRHAVK